jgi:hypothetical protein
MKNVPNLEKKSQSFKITRYKGLSEREEKSGGCHLKKLLMTS